MNHLAHLFLGGDDPETLLGNLAGDFVKGRLEGRFSDAVREGIAQHRKIDAFTDAHPLVGEFRRRVDHGHYGRVIADMFFDHFLSGEWRDYSDEPLPDFLARTFAALDPLFDQMPARLRRIYPRLRDEGWLLSYREVEGIRRALFFISRRFSRAPRLESAAQLLVDARPQLLSLFHSAFPDVIAFAKALRSRA